MTATHPALDALIGRSVADVPTPALVLDLDAFDRNARAIHATLRQHGVTWRPHAKAHGSPVLARRQLDVGAIGVTCATVAEAVALARGGVPSVLIANEVATRAKAATIAELQLTAEVIVCVDSIAGVRLLDAAGRAAGVEIPVMVEIDIGMARAGVQPGPELDRLVAVLVATETLRLAGVMGYEGHTLDLAPPAQKAGAIGSAIERLLVARDEMERAGVRVRIVSCGGTGSFQLTAGIDGVTEIQAGGGCFFDRFYAEACAVEGLEFALTVHGTVVSRPTAERAIVDAGFKSMSMSDGMPRPLVDGATVSELFAEHGCLRLDGPARSLAVGDRIPFVPGYSDSTTMLHGAFVAARRGVVESIIPRSPRWPG